MVVLISYPHVQKYFFLREFFELLIENKYGWVSVFKDERNKFRKVYKVRAHVYKPVIGEINTHREHTNLVMDVESHFEDSVKNVRIVRKFPVIKFARRHRVEIRTGRDPSVNLSQNRNRFNVSFQS